MRLRGPAALAVSAALGLAAGCGTVPGADGGAHPAVTTSASAPSTDAASSTPPFAGAASAGPAPATAPDVRREGQQVTADAWTVWVQATTLDVAGGADGSTGLTSSGDALIAAAQGMGFTLLDDGSVVVLDPAGTPVAGLRPPVTTPESVRASFEALAPDLLALRAGTAGYSVEVSFGTAAGLVATWGEAEGGRSLAVDPTAWVRSGGDASERVGWAAVIAAQPDADTPGMHDQFTCHVLGAPDKATWNLEPWRPEVGLLATLVARCNP